VAVADLNLGVAVWFELGTARVNENALIGSRSDRTNIDCAGLAAIPSDARRRRRKRFDRRLEVRASQRPGNCEPMNGTESTLAARLRAQLPADKAKYPVWASVRDLQPPNDVHGLPRTPVQLFSYLPVTAGRN